MATNAFAAYRENQVLTASPLKLICLAYGGAIDAIADARTHLKSGAILERSQAITKAQLILQELQNGLDHARGGEISKQLQQLYLYMQSRLTEANFKQIEEPLMEVQGLLENLNSAWSEIASQDQPLSVAAEVGGGYHHWMASESTYTGAELTL